MIGRLTLRVLALLTVLLAAGAPAHAQDESSGTSFITPFPAGDTYVLQVIGDDLAEGLLGGITGAFQGDQRLLIRPQAFNMNGLMRGDFDEKLVQLEEDLKRDPVHVAIVMLGAWDRVSIRDAQGKRLQVGTPAWRQEYASRGDRLMKALKRRNVAIYWVGLPIVRRWEANEDAQMMNEVMRERVYLNGQKYIDAYAGFTDENGGYSAYGPDLTGKIRLLRAGDGVYFTTEGYRKLAHFVERDLRRDLNQAKAGRTIPLAGDEAEQAKINPDKAKLAAPAPGANEPASKPSTEQAPTAAAPDSGVGEQKADNGKVNLRIIGQGGKEEVVALDIVRPAIPASVVALVTRRESADRLSQLGEPVLDQIAGGLTVMSTVALASGPTAGGRSRLAPSQTPYFRVLFKGERLTPRPGRADDMSWPRPPDPPEQAFLPIADPVETGTTVSQTPAPTEKQSRRKSRE